MGEYLMKKLLPLALAAVLVAPAAHAEGFQGLYAGVEGGFDNYEVKVDDIDISYLTGFESTGSFDGLSGNGAMGGVFAGYHLGGSGSTFFAVEGFAQLSDASMSISATDGVDTISASIRAKESFGVAAKAGVKVNNATGLYARVGWLSTNFETKINDGVDTYKESETEDAIQYGAGLETMVSDNISLRAEYLMADYGDQGIDGLSIDNNNFKAGLAFRF